PEFHALLAAQKVTVLSQTPSAFDTLLQTVAGEDGAAGELGCVETVVFGGEALVASRLGAWLAGPGRRPRLINMYGITETTVHATWREITAADTVTGPGSPVGVGLAGMRVAVLDNGLRMAPVGVTGELYLAGPQVADG
ncbi:AMP-binding protein, partial [Nocardia sp. 2]